ncbi:acyl-homoserine-lactone synthase [Paucibacter sp. APW11]|uniref:Acyl-homoserine-lactone synthase n=1 Tax=Roseateles aquae TaxID=3077235 RepID=A0ABU3PA82_9BURK|nr:acyl-homoserine-lactone synthase [Paucibacter sp. APW11]MDT8998636.1 acyl-homoserine-lactone synthase [Paucibacter sp. APW11]
MQIISASPRDMPKHMAKELARYRHRVFVEMLGWQMRCENGLEFDEFDRPDTRYVVSRDESGHINGCARLLPTTAPYLLSKVFPELMQGRAMPCSPEVWELSRFAAVGLSDAISSPMLQFSSPIAIGLLRAALEAAAEQGAHHVITVSPLGIERLLRRAGFRAERAAPPVTIDGKALFACWIPVI